MKFPTLVTLAALIAFATISSASAEITYKQNKNHQTIELSGLNDDPSCVTKWPINGKIIKRNFEKDELTLKDFVVEETDGTRDHINVFLPDDLSEVLQSIAYDGLQRLTRPGRTIRGNAVLCGASGAVMMLDRIQ